MLAFQSSQAEQSVFVLEVAPLAHLAYRSDIDAYWTAVPQVCYQPPHL